MTVASDPLAATTIVVIPSGASSDGDVGIRRTVDNPAFLATIATAVDRRIRTLLDAETER